MEDGPAGAGGRWTGSRTCSLDGERGGPIRLVGDGVDDRGAAFAALPSCAEASGPLAGRRPGVRISTQSRMNRGVVAFGVLNRGGVVGRAAGGLEGDNSNSSGSSSSVSSTIAWFLLLFVGIAFFWRVTRGRLGPGPGFAATVTPTVERGAALRVREAIGASCGVGSTSAAASSAAAVSFDLRGLDGGGATISASAVLLERSDLLGAGWTSLVVVDALRFGGMSKRLAVVDGFAQPLLSHTSADPMGIGATRGVTLCHSASTQCTRRVLCAYSSTSMRSHFIACGLFTGICVLTLR